MLVPDPLRFPRATSVFSEIGIDSQEDELRVIAAQGVCQWCPDRGIVRVPMGWWFASDFEQLQAWSLSDRGNGSRVFLCPGDGCFAPDRPRFGDE